MLQNHHHQNYYNNNNNNKTHKTRSLKMLQNPQHPQEQNTSFKLREAYYANKYYMWEVKLEQQRQNFI